MGSGRARIGYYLRMAIRNVSSKKTRAALTIFGIAIGIMTIVSLQAISNGTRNLLSEEMAKIFGGGVIITSKSPTSIADIPEELVDVLEANEDIEFATGIVVFATQIGTNVFPLYGVIPEKMSVIINIPIAEGRAVYANETDTILVGYTVARRLNVKVNDSLPISIPGGNSKVFKVVGVGAASSPERDSAIVMSLRAAQELLGVEGYVTLVFVRPAKNVDPRALAEALEEAMPNADVTEQTEVMEQAEEIIDRVDLALKALGSIGLIVAALGTMNTITMSVMERIREIGILKSIGAKKSHILFIFLTESFVISLIGGALGSLMGITLALTIRFAVQQALAVAIPVLITYDLAGYGILLAVVTGTFSAFYPSWRGATIPPVEALRYV